MSDADSNIQSAGDSNANSGSGIESSGNSFNRFGDSDSDSDDAASFFSADEHIIHPNELVEETTFADEEDAIAFRGISKHQYREMVIPLKNFLNNKKVFKYNFHSQLSDVGKVRLGSFIARARHLTRLHVTLREGQPQSVGLVFQGPFHIYHDLLRLKIDAGDDVSFAVKLSLNDWSCFSRYVRKAASLRHLEINNLTLGRDELEILASALQAVTLETLALSKVKGDDSLGILFTSMNPTKLDTIHLTDCIVGISTCEGLANILRNKESKLDFLNLYCTPLDNDCVEALCESLVENTSVTNLQFHDTEDITDEGWKRFEKLVYDKSNLESIYQSNHTLRHVAGHPRPGVFNANEPQRGTKKGHAKILTHLTWLTDYEPGFNIEPFIGFDVEMIPYVLEFFGKDRLDLKTCSWSPPSLLYEIIRGWNVPELFCFPSSEKVRLSTRMNALETEIEMLRAENSRLTMEVNQFKSKIDESTDHERNQDSKRSRVE